MVKAVIFDFYGVLCKEIGSQWYNTRPPEKLIPELKKKYDAPSDVGEITEQEFFDGIAKSVHSTGPDVRKEWLEAAAIDPVVIALIKELKLNYKIALCSNTVSALFREILATNHIESLFDVVVASSEIGLVKPQPEIFAYTLEKLSVLPIEAVFTDDNETNVMGAKNAGIQSVLYTNPHELKLYLDRLG